MHITHIRAHQAAWKAGIAKADVTPTQPLWLSGYASRDRPAEGTLHPLWIKVLALEDPTGHRAVVLTSDLLGFSKAMYDDLCAALHRQFGLDHSQIMLTYSHTHCGPVLRESLFDYYPLDEAQVRMINEYSRWLEQIIIETIGRTLSQLVPAHLFAGEGLTAFAVNRRNNREAEVASLLEQGVVLNGPVDHSVPVLAVRSLEGRLLTLVFGYACHNTTLSFYQWCGDYAGFAQIALEKSHPDALAMFYSGCGADQNPLPRRSVTLCERYGMMLAAAVEEVLRRPMKPLAPALRTAFEFVSLHVERLPTREELEAAVTGSNVIRSRWAARILRMLAEGTSFAQTFPYAVQVWRLGEDQLWISLAGEVVVDYALRFKQEFGPGTWVCGYAHDMVAYIPSRRVWNEGGYEGATLYEYMLPADRWASDVEERVASSVARLVQQANR